MASYNHNQDSSSVIWTIVHGLGTDSIVIDVMVDYNGDLQKILPKKFEVTNINTVIVTFESAHTGRARVVGDV